MEKLLPMIKGSPNGRSAGPSGYFPLYQLSGWEEGAIQAPIKTGESASARAVPEGEAMGSLSLDRETMAKETVTVASEVLQENESRISSETDSVALEDSTEEMASIPFIGLRIKKILIRNKIWHLWI